MRDLQLIKNASVCQDSHWLRDPTVRTREQATERGHQNCPRFDECNAGGLLGPGKLSCIPRSGMDVARFAREGRVPVRQEMSDFRQAPFLNEVRGFIDPYDDPDAVLTDKEGAFQRVEAWANDIVGPAETSQQLQANIAAAHCEFHDGFLPGCNGCGVARVAALDRTDVVRPNGIPQVVERDLCRCPILQVGDFCPVHGG
ncbi:hypothetical protein HYX70_00485 [Candidatus Saccharibacteria bacterium]|nr:hypothetical protein [Candidatus Saccharibacteria bacterium]